MRLWERAYLYVGRKKRKSLLLSLTIFLLSSVSTAGLLLRGVTDLAAVQTRESLGGAFRIAPDMQDRENVRLSEGDGQIKMSYVGDPLDGKVIDAIQSTQGICGYNAIIKEHVLLQGDISLVDFNGKYQDDPVAMRLISVEADTNSSYSEDFQRGRLRLSEGGHITKGDKYVAVASRDLAVQNGWEIGDEILLAPSEDCTGQETRVTIKGLFEVEAEQQDLDVAAPVHLLQNRIFTDMTSAGCLAGTLGADYIDFFVEDPAQVKTMIEEIQEISNINWGCFAFMANIEEYEKISSPLVNLSVLLDALLATIAVMGIAVLSLIQILFHKARRHEIGIMLSIGISKAEIVLQHFIEMAIVALASFVLSFVFCFSAWSCLGGAIGKIAALNIDMGLDIVLAVKTIFITFGCGMAVLLVSVLLSNFCLMRLSPNTIFSKLS